MTGKFVAFEGGDANGKNTQSKILAEKLDALLISFPRYETAIGQLIKRSLQKDLVAAIPWFGELCVDDAANAVVRQALFTLDRYDAASDIVRALQSGRSVVADRYWVSGLMYGASDLVDSGMLERVHRQLPQPDVWILLDVPVEESFRRRPERADVYERDRDKLEGIRRRYLELFRAEIDKVRPRQTILRRWEIVDGVGSIDEVHARVLEATK